MANKQTKHNLTLGASGMSYKFPANGSLSITVSADSIESFIMFKDIDDNLICNDSATNDKVQLKCKGLVKANTEYIATFNMTKFTVTSFTYIEGE